MIPYGRQNINQTDLDAVAKALKSDFITQGPKVPEFESSVAKYVNAKYAVASNSATSSLHVACLALGIKKDDFVWTPAISFVATSNSAVYCGAKIRFIDIEQDTFNISIPHLEAELKIAKKQGELPKLVIVTHMCGQSVDMTRLSILRKKYKFKVIEDASHAIGGEYNHQKIGSCQYSDISVFSFHPVKIITTAEGGICTTNQEDLFIKLKKLISHGITRDEGELIQSNAEPWFYEQQLLGFNYRMTELQAALGLSQIKRLDRFIKKRNVLAKRYLSLFKDSPFCMPKVIPNCVSSFHLFVIRLNSHESYKRNEVFKKLRRKGIGVNLHYIPIYKHPYYSNELGFKNTYLENSEDYYSRAISIPMYPDLTLKEQRYVVKMANQSIQEINKK
ncbi:UDP-4-amino-4,6-dideoxy-N-acetyl-beta-L-altrosamine transaminase [Gammaproteobacteria bacterium]|jgi:UDP-4-amino-4,6-dideoxy-N-acetyl-beta-L-altrosamine transaminase|nr:UDP-4-amino-4,6-dideoxy-N-acetyl-beta-L-altrosamine transaminase [Gammaproteobacteria bacterium]MDC0129016.1 UDP-4-amino-4,6-dideoxy-N-acetyl-beta-L-altrosamine transaminase [Gammaproteobacteria bacterium]